MPAAKELITYLQERKQVQERAVASDGYDLPPLLSMSNFEIWAEVEPPRGTVYNYPIRPWHNSLESIYWLSGATRHCRADVCPRDTSMLAKIHSGQSTKEVIAWAKNELEGFNALTHPQS